MVRDGMRLVPTEFDGGVIVHVNGVLLPADGKGMDEDEAFRMRYSIRNTSVGHWAVLEDVSCRLSKAYDAFIYGGMPSGRREDFVDDTTWPTPEEAALALEEFRDREVRRCIDAGFRKFGEPRKGPVAEIHPDLEGDELLEFRIKALVRRRAEAERDAILLEMGLLYGDEAKREEVGKGIERLLAAGMLEYMETSCSEGCCFTKLLRTKGSR